MDMSKCDNADTEHPGFPCNHAIPLYEGNLAVRMARLVGAFADATDRGDEQRADAVKAAYRRLYDSL
jgi:hypothetical protein